MKRIFALLSLIGMLVGGFAAARAVKRWLEGPEPEPFETSATAATEAEWSNALDEELLSILVDPQTKKPLEYDEDNNWLTSYDSRLRYPIQNGIPVMLIDKAEKIGDDVQAKFGLPMTGLGDETINQVRAYRERRSGTGSVSVPSSGTPGSEASGNGVNA